MKLFIMCNSPSMSMQAFQVLVLYSKAMLNIPVIKLAFISACTIIIVKCESFINQFLSMSCPGKILTNQIYSFSTYPVLGKVQTFII